MSSFNLLQLVPSLNSGGVERGTIDLANYLSEQKIKNHIISNGGELLKELDSNTFHKKLPVHTKNFLKYLSLSKSIDNYIKSNKINILHVRSRAPSWIVRFLNKKNLKTVGSYHNVYGGNSFIKKLYNKNLSNMDYVLAISNYVKDSIVKKYNINPHKVKVISRGIDTNFFREPISEIKKQNLIKNLKINTNNKIILYPGRITNWKGQLKFVQNLKKNKKPDFCIYFVGSDENTGHAYELKKLIAQAGLSEICKLVGSLDKENLKIMYSISNLVLSAPLRPEGFGRVISESIFLKIPILAFNYGGAKEQLDGISPLYSCKPLDYNELSKKINEILIYSKEKLSSIKDEAYKKINTNYTKDIMVKNYKNFYDEISSK